ncbi:hypothetical protein N7460_001773 [Penicillium canescens]|uniref:Uncharacterized protein n=1 Tax=Penicillium canescens TaxID=5083 RepID=A0AAD6NBZ9_PENCN|nr:hypothetical protein N7460_001773 [Penicillium canescens]KAJ6064999.1 hypothetical protein N7444_000652 [Penicillium canescens]KAJ6183230.1 hypothetical protein N7485_001872 [Penicillium canescens]
MSRRTSTMASSDSNSGVPPSGDGGQEKQKMLLSSEQGHFSLVKALHLADLVTEMNGFCGGKLVFPISLTISD